jgi:hypothetical protein
MNFLKRVESFFGRLFGHAPSVLQKLSSAVSFAGPVIVLVAQETAGPEYGDEVANIVGEVKTGLATASAVIASSHSGTPAPSVIQAIAGVISGVNENLNGLLAAGHIKNADTKAKVTAIVGEFAAVLSELAPPPAPAPAPAPATPTAA